VIAPGAQVRVVALLATSTPGTIDLRAGDLLLPSGASPPSPPAASLPASAEITVVARSADLSVELSAPARLTSNSRLEHLVLAVRDKGPDAVGDARLSIRTTGGSLRVVRGLTSPTCNAFANDGCLLPALTDADVQRYQLLVRCIGPRGCRIVAQVGTTTASDPQPANNEAALVLPPAVTRSSPAGAAGSRRPRSQKGPG
jgi:hypothetical protein